MYIYIFFFCPGATHITLPKRIPPEHKRDEYLVQYCYILNNFCMVPFQNALNTLKIEVFSLSHVWV